MKKISATLVAAPALCLAEYMAATNRPSTQSCVKRLMNGFDCTKPKADRFPDRHLFAKSKRLFDSECAQAGQQIQRRRAKSAIGFTRLRRGYGEVGIAIDRFEGPGGSVTTTR